MASKEADTRACEQGKQCAFEGRPWQVNPFLNTEKSGEYTAWSRGFLDHSTPDPDCSDCKGTGKLTMRAVNLETGETVFSKYNGLTIRCYCNKPCPEQTPHSPGEAIE